MDEVEARKVLKVAITPDDNLYCLGHYMAWAAGPGQYTICLDDDFTADELEAIVWWMRHKSDVRVVNRCGPFMPPCTSSHL
jgi:hypothetical protein